eukprot:TRINITY_DN10833_c0_g1_i1.p1 TRINITY_DN10833_c0_g1~~TRINITY_DN10833_c0_g1_i1.p1  ORF type:complete len:632 (-),score=112.03 TRINITY_DN10833_c0_g1_i1:39-1691(-)
MKELCNNMNGRMDFIKSNSGDLLEVAEEIVNRRQENIIKKEVIDALLSKYQLSKKEENILKAVEIKDEAFFNALQRVHEIDQECRILLRTQYQELAWVIMNKMEEYTKSAYKKICRWIKIESKKLDTDDPFVSELYMRAFASLRKRLVLLSFCLEIFGNTRKKTIKKCFLNALTVGGEGGMPRPIEIHAHDPFRYVSDMLAWIHQFLATESILIQTLIGPNDPDDEDNEKCVDLANKTLVVCMSGVCSPLKSRIDNLITSKLGVVLSYRLGKLFEYYISNFKERIGGESPLVVIMNNCMSDINNYFVDSIKRTNTRLLASPPVPPSDMSPAHDIHEIINIIEDVLRIHTSSMSISTDLEIDSLMEILVEPLLKICKRSTTTLSDMEQSVYLINTYSFVREMLEKFEATQSFALPIKSTSEDYLNELISKQTKSILEQCGLDHKLVLIEAYKYKPNTPLCTVREMTPPDIIETLRKFEDKLLDLGTLSMPFLDRIYNIKYRSQARELVSELVSNSYSEFFEAITDPVNAYEDARSLFRYNPEQIKTMIEIC